MRFARSTELGELQEVVRANLGRRALSCEGCFVPTKDSDLLTLFDVSRSLEGWLEGTSGILLSLGEPSPFCESAEDGLRAMIFQGCGWDPLKSSSMVFEANDSDAFVALLASLMALKDDFHVYSLSSKMVGEHSHDGGMWITNLPDEAKLGLQGIGF